MTALSFVWFILTLKNRGCDTCIAKHVSTTLEWDDIVPLACTAYNFFPNEHSRKSHLLDVQMRCYYNQK